MTIVTFEELIPESWEPITPSSSIVSLGIENVEGCVCVCMYVCVWGIDATLLPNVVPFGCSLYTFVCQKEPTFRPEMSPSEEPTVWGCEDNGTK